ncbi:MAG: threonine synthase [Spirochaetaceae bacterium]|jgi:threonine synthase|nr:threonine synthase [Spirochaetaceae bacterium]
MILASTRNKNEIKTFHQAIFIGLSPEGGLYYPTETPDMRDIISRFDKSISFNDMSSAITAEFLKDELDKKGAERIVNNAFYFEPQIKDLSENLQVLELFHGGTCAFKDFGASFLASSMEEFLKGKDDKAIILTATSGDTGSAVARAFHNKKNIDVIILYPSGRVSPLQEKQLTTLGGNIQALEVEGNFDDCQRMVKEAFSNAELKQKYKLTSANSINIGRLFPQSFYYIWAEIQGRARGKKPVFTVPSGNFGNLTAGLYASTWGLPVKHFIAATNNNDVVPQYLKKGLYEPRASVQTYSNAMDVGAPSNFERMLQLYNGNVDSFLSQISGVKIDDKETTSAMKQIYKDYNYLACPHTAVGIEASQRYLKENPQDWVISLSTAHPGKFLEVSQDVLGITPELPEELKVLQNKKKYSYKILNETEELQAFLKKHY